MVVCLPFRTAFLAFKASDLALDAAARVKDQSVVNTGQLTPSTQVKKRFSGNLHDVSFLLLGAMCLGKGDQLRMRS